MSRPSQTTVFLERSAYRRRRMADAARLLPVLGLLLLALPMFWGGGQGVRTASVMFFVFGVWALLAGLGAALTTYLGAGSAEDLSPEDDRNSAREE